MAGLQSSVRLVTNAECCFIGEDKICRLIINLQPEQKLIKDLPPIALPSSPAIANTPVMRRPAFCPPKAAE